MARDGGGALVPAAARTPAPAPAARAPATARAPAPAAGQVYLPAWRRAYDRLVKILRQLHAQAVELSVEREHLITEIEFLQSERREREEISQARLHQMCKHEELHRRVAEAETVVRVGEKELQIHCHQKLAELAEDDLKDFKSCISALAVENTELKVKLKKIESMVEISTDNSNHLKSVKDLRKEIRRLKNAYKTLKSENDKEISALLGEKDFVWNQLRSMENDYKGTLKLKNLEVEQATEAAQKLLQNVDELQAAAQKKDGEIVRLQVEVTNAKERVSALEDELQKLRSLVKDKDLETDTNDDDQSDTSKMSKKDTSKAKRTSADTPDRQEGKTPRTHVSVTNQKRKRSSHKSILSAAS